VRAAILFGPEDLRVQQVPEPQGEVIVTVEAATTCGTDVKMWRHGHRVLGSYPCAFGHEMAGVRTDTGERVLVSDSVSCRRCPQCLAGRPQICRDPTWVLGGFAERIAAPVRALHPIPGDLPPPAAAMAEPLAAALHAVARGTDDADVGILGGGPMGLMIASLLITRGRSVTLADRHPERRCQAEQLGARAVTALDRRALVFEAVGRPEAWTAALRAARPGGVVVLVGGCPPGAEVDAALAALASGEVDWRVLAGETITLEQLPGVLATPSGGRARKWVVDPRATG
jgi:L-iditol 2-dehydrogenase